MSRGIWRTLGIEPTTDRSAIRRAYAAKLRGMDVDADPAGFARLRDARDAALAGVADPVAMLPDLDDDSDDDKIVADGFFTPEPEPLPQARVDPVEAERDAAIDHHFRALEALLFPGHDDPSTAEEAAAIAHHGYALLADPRLERIDFAVGAERWFAEHLAIAIPRSDPLLERAAAVFGWIARRDDHTLSPHAREIVDRIGAIRFATLVGDPGHRLHRAWVELVRSDDGPHRWGTTGGRVRELLLVVRQRYPDAEQWMNPVRVAKWDRPASDNPRIGFYIWLVLIIIVAAVRVLSGPSDDPREQAPVVIPTLSSDANLLAQHMTGKGIAALRQEHPELAEAIRTTTAPLPGNVDPAVADRAVDTLYQQRLLAGFAKAPDDLLRDVAAFELDAMRLLAPTIPAQCRRFVVSSDPNLLNQGLRERQQRLVHRIILESDDRNAGDGSYRFTLPSSIATTIRTRTGLSADQVKNALSDKGKDTDVCAVNIALREAALRDSKNGMRLLRDMRPSGDDN
ncbi:hypothetical protein [Sphingomonas sp. Leaf25]|uniref:hypothetical protein n=1 Tax=Sphingomonas sp. Leaf25 TaxID=1735692 RepID=UPI0006FA4B34|nr:hypothetical protein [Sphingomonas sp. Leaf25]KQN00226.1 hypothetical protein ASE78_03565 [Sphingomonas sp. Leaf25]